MSELSSGLRLRLSPRSRGAEETHVVEAYEAFAKGMLNLRIESYEAWTGPSCSSSGRWPSTPATPVRTSAGVDLRRQGGLPDHPRAARARDRVLPPRDRARPRPRGGLEGAGLRAHVAGPRGGRDRGPATALALDPADAPSHAALARAFFIGRADFDRRRRRVRDALRLNPQAGWSALQLAHCAALRRDFARGGGGGPPGGLSPGEDAVGRDGVVIVGSYMRLGHLAALQGRHREGLEHFERSAGSSSRAIHALRNRTTIELHQRIGSAHLHLGEHEEARAAFQVASHLFEERLRLGADDPYTRFYVAGIHALRGEPEHALSSLGRAVRMRRRFNVARARIEPEFASLREDHVSGRWWGWSSWAGQVIKIKRLWPGRSVISEWSCMNPNIALHS